MRVQAVLCVMYMYMKLPGSYMVVPSISTIHIPIAMKYAHTLAGHVVVGKYVVYEASRAVVASSGP